MRLSAVLPILGAGHLHDADALVGEGELVVSVRRVPPRRHGRFIALVIGGIGARIDQPLQRVVAGLSHGAKHLVGAFSRGRFRGLFLHAVGIQVARRVILVQVGEGVFQFIPVPRGGGIGHQIAAGVNIARAAGAVKLQRHIPAVVVSVGRIVAVGPALGRLHLRGFHVDVGDVNGGVARALVAVMICRGGHDHLVALLFAVLHHVVEGLAVAGTGIVVQQSIVRVLDDDFFLHAVDVQIAVVVIAVEVRVRAVGVVFAVEGVHGLAVHRGPRGLGGIVFGVFDDGCGRPAADLPLQGQLDIRIGCAAQVMASADTVGLDPRLAAGHPGPGLSVDDGDCLQRSIGILFKREAAVFVQRIRIVLQLAKAVQREDDVRGAIVARGGLGFPDHIGAVVRQRMLRRVQRIGLCRGGRPAVKRAALGLNGRSVDALYLVHGHPCPGQRLRVGLVVLLPHVKRRGGVLHAQHDALGGGFDGFRAGAADDDHRAVRGDLEFQPFHLCLARGIQLVAVRGPGLVQGVDVLIPGRADIQRLIDDGGVLPGGPFVNHDLSHRIPDDQLRAGEAGVLALAVVGFAVHLQKADLGGDVLRGIVQQVAASVLFLRQTGHDAGPGVQPEAPVPNGIARGGGGLPQDIALAVFKVRAHLGSTRRGPGRTHRRPVGVQDRQRRACQRLALFIHLQYGDPALFIGVRGGHLDGGGLFLLLLLVRHASLDLRVLGHPDGQGLAVCAGRDRGIFGAQQLRHKPVIPHRAQTAGILGQGIGAHGQPVEGRPHGDGLAVLHHLQRPVDLPAHRVGQREAVCLPDELLQVFTLNVGIAFRVLQPLGDDDPAQALLVLIVQRRRNRLPLFHDGGIAGRGRGQEVVPLRVRLVLIVPLRECHHRALGQVFDRPDHGVAAVGRELGRPFGHILRGLDARGQRIVHPDAEIRGQLGNAAERFGQHHVARGALLLVGDGKALFGAAGGAEQVEYIFVLTGAQRVRLIVLGHAVHVIPEHGLAAHGLGILLGQALEGPGITVCLHQRMSIRLVVRRCALLLPVQRDIDRIGQLGIQRLDRLIRRALLDRPPPGVLPRLGDVDLQLPFVLIAERDVEGVVVVAARDLKRGDIAVGGRFCVHNGIPVLFLQRPRLHLADISLPVQRVGFDDVVFAHRQAEADAGGIAVDGHVRQRERLDRLVVQVLDVLVLRLIHVQRHILLGLVDRVAVLVLDHEGDLLPVLLAQIGQRHAQRRVDLLGDVHPAAHGPVHHLQAVALEVHVAAVIRRIVPGDGELIHRVVHAIAAGRRLHFHQTVALSLFQRPAIVLHVALDVHPAVIARGKHMRFTVFVCHQRGIAGIQIRFLQPRGRV